VHLGSLRKLGAGLFSPIHTLTSAVTKFKADGLALSKQPPFHLIGGLLDLQEAVSSTSLFSVQGAYTSGNLDLAV
jgi:hypothetical protein